MDFVVSAVLGFIGVLLGVTTLSMWDTREQRDTGIQSFWFTIILTILYLISVVYLAQK